MTSLQLSDTNLAEKLHNKKQKSGGLKAPEDSKKAQKEIEKMMKQQQKAQVKQQKAEVRQVEAQNDEDREKLIWKIKKYFSSKRFSQYLQKEIGIHYTQAQLRKKTTPQLHNILNRVRVALDNMNVDNMIDGTLKTGCVFLEKTLDEIYNIDGFTDMLWENQQFLNALERTKIETDIPTIPPHIQLSVICLQTAIICHKLNELKLPPKPIEPPTEPPEPQNEDEKDKEKKPEPKPLLLGDLMV